MSEKRTYGVYDTDNFSGDYPNEKWVIQPYVKESTAKAIATLLNNDAGEDSPRYYCVGDRDYKLQPGFEP